MTPAGPALPQASPITFSNFQQTCFLQGKTNPGLQPPLGVCKDFTFQFGEYELHERECAAGCQKETFQQQHTIYLDSSQQLMLLVGAVQTGRQSRGPLLGPRLPPPGLLICSMLGPPLQMLGSRMLPPPYLAWVLEADQAAARSRSFVLGSSVSCTAQKVWATHSFS